MENYWNWKLLDTVEAVTETAEGMRWKGQHPVVKLVSKTYETGIRLSRQAMQELETRLKRLPGLEKWFIDIPYAEIFAVDT